MNVVNLKGLFNVSDILSNIDLVQKEFNKIGADHNVSESLNKSFRDLRQEIQNFDVLLGSSEGTKGMKQVSESFERLQHHSDQLKQSLAELKIPLKNIDFSTMSGSLTKELRESSDAFTAIEAQLKNYKDNLKNLEKYIKDKFAVTSSTLGIDAGVKKAISSSLTSYEDLVKIRQAYNESIDEAQTTKKADLSAMEAEKAAIADLNSATKKKQTAQNTVIADLNAEIATRSKAVETISAQIKEIEKVNTAAKGRKAEKTVTDTSAEFDKTYQDRVVALEKLKTLEKEYNEAVASGDTGKQATTSKGIIEQQKAISDYTTKLNALKIALKEAEKTVTEFGAQQQKLKDLTKEKSTLNEEIATYKTELTAASTALKLLNAELASGTKDETAKAEAIKKLSTEIDSLIASQQRMAGVFDEAEADATNYAAAQDEVTKKTEEQAVAGERLKEAYGATMSEAVGDVADRFQKLIDAILSMNPAVKANTQAYAEQEAKMRKVDSTFQGLIGRVEMYLGAMALFQQVGRVIKSSINDFKEFDAAFTEIAVVTNYSVKELWTTFNEYNALAAKLGTTTTNAIKTSALFYQQGLSTAEVWKITEETMKMATIAGMEFTDATNKMTAALRGFSMSVSEAGHVNDVFSVLAAKAAVDTEGLATALSKTASIAANAGMSFENTTAFLAKMQEVTQEAAENIGTSLKTIIARFVELKKNPLSLTVEVEGETVDANKIESALRLAGVDLRDTTGQFRDLDDVILELGSAWDSLDRLTQRYIATTVAGSRLLNVNRLQLAA